jgi:hypothetical protein
LSSSMDFRSIVREIEINLAYGWDWALDAVIEHPIIPVVGILIIYLFWRIMRRDN